MYHLSGDLCSHSVYFFKNAYIFKAVVSLCDLSDFLLLRSEAQNRTELIGQLQFVYRNEKKGARRVKKTGKICTLLNHIFKTLLIRVILGHKSLVALIGTFTMAVSN